MKKELNILLIQVLIAILPILSAFIIRMLNLKSEEIKQKTKNNKLDNYIDYAKDIIVKCVIAVNQTYVNELKNNNSFTIKNQKEAFNLAKRKALSMINEDAKKALSTLYTDIDTFIDTQIEVAVNSMKYFKVDK